MPGAVNEDQSRAYVSPIRREQAEFTRRRIARAARQLFLEQGYARTTIRQVADTAGVSEQTVYVVYGNKRGLALAVIDDLDLAAGSTEMRHLMERAGDDATQQLSVMVSFDRRFFERGGDVLMMLRFAGATEPELAAGYSAGRERARQMHMRDFQRWQSLEQLHESLTPEQAADIFHTISSIDTYGYLVGERGWTPDQWQERTGAILASVLLRADDVPETEGGNG